MHSRLFSLHLLFLIFLTTHASSNNNKNPSHLIGDISINCGSASSSSASLNGREWTGDENPKIASSLQIKGSSKTSTTAIHKFDDPVPHRTARISLSQFSYTFHLNSGQKILRFHFNPAKYKSFKKFKDLFNVEAGPFTLLSNFSASLTAEALSVNSFTKEFCISIEENQPLTIVFSPENSQSQDRTYAFINGIEIISVPTHLSYFTSREIQAQVVGQKSLVYIDNSTALEIIHRMNVKRDSISFGDDLFDDMYGVLSEKAPKERAKERENLVTWKKAVDIGFRYMVRIHFSNLGLEFKVLINEMVVDTNVEILGGKGFLRYRDYIVVMKGRKQEGKGKILISLQSENEFLDGYGALKGFEIFKLTNPDNNLASPNPLPSRRDSPPGFFQNLLALMGQRNTIATVAIAIFATVNTIVYMLRQFYEAKSLTEDKRKPSPRAERLFRRFSLSEIQSATKNFSYALLIGKGGFGKVYKGLIGNGQETVAIKRLKFSSRQGANEFWTEIETLSELRHMNLVSLVGYCNEQTEFILVYEYMPGGTLSDHLFHKHGNSFSSLTWIQRLNICIGAGRGLDYLHTGHRVIHRDVKASNILLDENLVPKVSDFGLAKFENRSKSQSHVSTNVKGTFGYFDPYYFRTRKLTRKSDTYAFGVVLLEVLCGRRAIDPRLGEDKCSLTKWALSSISNGEVNQIIDSSLVDEISPDSLTAFIGVAERCLHDEPKERPTMAQVVLQLEFALELQETGRLSSPNQIISVANDVSPSNDETILWVSNEQITKASTEVKAVTPPRDSKMANADPQSSNRDGRKKMHKPLRLWPWDAFWNMVKPSKKKESLETAMAEFHEANLNLQKFDLATIAAATYQFSNNIGIGAFGPVYKAVLPSGRIVAVKRMTPFSRQGEIYFKSEAILLSKVQHQNIRNLLGYCNDGGERMLVYEFIQNGSLDAFFIFDEAKQLHLVWSERFRIIMGIAKGVLYLHQDSGLRIIHRDIQPGNILLDTEMNPKISGFYWARTFNENQSEEETSKVAGTYRYMPPEYAIEGKFSVKSDVYSFGILVLEIVSGQKNMGFTTNDFTLVEYGWKLWNEERPLDLIDKSLGGAFSLEEALRCIQVGLLCAQEKPDHRPMMPSVINMLLGEELSLELQDKVTAAATHKGNMGNAYNLRNPYLADSSFVEDISAATFENDSMLER